MTIKEILETTGGKLYNCVGEDIAIRGVSTDTRTIKEGQLFIALKSAARDGHQFVLDAFRRGAKLTIVSKNIKTTKPIIKVKDTLGALGDIAGYYRRKFNVTAIGITGSNGKTTTKEILAHLLSARFDTIASCASFNNSIGVPLTTLRIKKNTQIVVQEMETNILGGIERLCNIAKPSVGVVTNIASTHLETLKTEYGVFKEKSELLKSLPPQGVSIMNSDDPYLIKLKETSSPKKIITFGIEKGADFRAKNIALRGNCLYFTLDGSQFSLNTFFYKNVYNALAAIAVSCGVFGSGKKKAASLLTKFKFLPLRAQLFKVRDIRIINDCFNANPASLKDALLTLKTIGEGRKLALLGDMFELGSKSQKLHYDAGKFCASLSLDGLICVGRLAKFIAKGARAGGIKSNQITYCKTTPEAVKSLIKMLKPHDTLLVKGSRAMKLEEIVDTIKIKL